MMATTMTFRVDAELCPVCGVLYGLSTDYLESKYISGDSWCCPNGHHIHYTKAKFQELQEEKAALQAKLDKLYATQRRFRGSDGRFISTKDTQV